MNDSSVVSAIDPARRIPETFLCLAEALFMCESSRMGRSPGGLPFRRVAGVRHGRRRQGVWTNAPSLNNLNERCRARTLKGSDLPPDRKPETIVTGCPSNAGEVFSQKRSDAARISEGVAP